ncbi:MAG: hypothetical protein IPM38_00020 [Ignavibacteria bacterium]|nr:hypothetical protein [Ignavibacteria bacterium]
MFTLLLHQIYERIYIIRNLSLSDNFFKEIQGDHGADSLGNITYGNDYSGNKIILTPDVIGNLSIEFFPLEEPGYLSLMHIGKYLDNSENERKDRCAFSRVIQIR